MMPHGIVALLVVLMSLGGCASARPDASNMPDDFSLGVAVLPGAAAQPAWFVLEPDGTLRAALGARREDSPRPPAVHVLTRSQVREVWELACAAGLAGEGVGKVASGAPGNPAGSAVVEIASAGRRRLLVAPLAGDAGGAGFDALHGKLRELAWLGEDSSDIESDADIGAGANAAGAAGAAR